MRIRGLRRHNFRRSRPIASRLIALVLVAVVPVLVFSTFLIFEAMLRQQHEVEIQLNLTARAFSQAVDRELGLHRAVALSLRQSPTLRLRDWTGFREQVDGLVQSYPWLRVAVIDPSGQLVFSSVSTPDGRLPIVNGRVPFQKAIETGEIQTSDLIISSMTKNPAIATYVPVMADGRVEQVLAVSCDAARFQDIVGEQNLETSTQSAIIDNQNLMIARAVRPEIYVGHPGPPELFDEASRKAEGVITLLAVDGLPSRVGYSHSKIANWVVAVGRHQSTLSDAVNATLFSNLVGGGVLLLLSLTGAFWYGRWIARQTTRLAAQATALGAGGPVRSAPFDIAELARIAVALEGAGQSLAREKEERQALLNVLESRVRERTAELTDSEGRYRMLAENSVDVIIRSGLDGIRRYVSPASYRVFGYEPEELLGLAVDALIHPGDAGIFEQVVSRLRQGEDDILSTYRVRRKDGDYIWCETAFRLLRSGPEDAPTEFLATARDISVRKAAQDSALEAVAAATRANMAKSLFLASMSHELRTPLNAIIGFTEMLQYGFNGPLTLRQSEYVECILRSGKSLLGLVHDLLELASIDSSPMPVVLEAVPLDSVLDELDETVSLLAANKSIAFTIDRSGPEALPVRADRRRLVQVLANLCSNGIKYNRPGGSLKVTLGADGPDRVAISVTDTGIGIPPDKYAAAFEPFNRLGAEAGMIEGTGIGLTISQRLIDAMMGRITLASEVGVGSTFTVILPTARDEPRADLG